MAMSEKKVMIFGHSMLLESEFGEDLKKILKNKEYTVVCEDNLNEFLKLLSKEPVKVVLLMYQPGHTIALPQWNAALKKLEHKPVLLAVSKGNLPPPYSKNLGVRKEFLFNKNLKECAEAIVYYHDNFDEVMQNIDLEAEEEAEKSIHIDIDKIIGNKTNVIRNSEMDDIDAMFDDQMVNKTQALENSDEDEFAEMAKLTMEEADLMDDSGDGLDDVFNQELDDLLDDEPMIALETSLSSELDIGEPKIDVEKQQLLGDTGDASSEELSLEMSVVADDADTLISEVSSELKEDLPKPAFIQVGLDGKSSDKESIVVEKEKNIQIEKSHNLLESLGGEIVSGFAEDLSVEPGEFDVGSLDLGTSAKPMELEGKDVETIKQYAQLKEREVIEREAAYAALAKKVEDLLEKYKKSELARRLLVGRVEEARVSIGTLEDFRDQQKMRERKVEINSENKIKEVQVKLESAEYRAVRSEKKLNEFREKVKNDILQVRSRERELHNKLEIQKRDAEALLSAKDKLILDQKREMDRFQFEIDNLKDRILDDTEKAEERIARISRGLQSLKMAEGILSSIDEEVLPSASEDEDAA